MIVTIAGGAFSFSPNDDELYAINLEFAAFDGDFGSGQFPMPDPTAAATMPTGRQFKVTQDSTLLTDGFIIDNDRLRGPFRVGTQREYGVSVQDANALLHGFRIQRTRTSETDYARVIAFAAADLPAADTTWVLNASTVTMPAKKYDSAGGWADLIVDLVEFTGKTLFLHDKANGSGRCLHYHLLTNGHTCGLTISDVRSAINNSTVFGPQQAIRQRTSVDLANDVKGRDQSGRTSTQTDVTSIAAHDTDGLPHQALIDFATTSQADLNVKTAAFLASSKDDLDTYTCTIGPLDGTALGLIRVGDLITVTSSVMGLTDSPQRIAHMRLKPAGGPGTGTWIAELELGAPIRRRARVSIIPSLQKQIAPPPVPVPGVGAAATTCVGPTSIPGSANGTTAVQTTPVATSLGTGSVTPDNPFSAFTLADVGVENLNITGLAGGILETDQGPGDDLYLRYRVELPIWTADDHDQPNQYSGFTTGYSDLPTTNWSWVALIYGGDPDVDNLYLALSMASDQTNNPSQAGVIGIGLTGSFYGIGGSGGGGTWDLPEIATERVFIDITVHIDPNAGLTGSATVDAAPDVVDVGTPGRYPVHMEYPIGSNPITRLTTEVGLSSSYAVPVIGIPSTPLIPPVFSEVAYPFDTAVTIEVCTLTEAPLITADFGGASGLRYLGQTTGGVNYILPYPYLYKAGTLKVYLATASGAPPQPTMLAPITETGGGGFDLLNDPGPDYAMYGDWVVSSLPDTLDVPGLDQTIAGFTLNILGSFSVSGPRTLFILITEAFPASFAVGRINAAGDDQSDTADVAGTVIRLTVTDPGTYYLYAYLSNVYHADLTGAGYWAVQ